MLADLIIALICGLALFIIRRRQSGGAGSSSSLSSSSSPSLPSWDLPPDLLWAFLGLVLLASSAWIGAFQVVGAGPTLGSVFTGDEPIWAIHRCHMAQGALASSYAERSRSGQLHLRCPTGGHISGTPPNLSCSLHGAAKPAAAATRGVP